MTDVLGSLSVLLCDENTQSKYVGQEFDDFIQIKAGVPDIMQLDEMGTMVGQIVRRICDEKNNKNIHIKMDAVSVYEVVLNSLRNVLKSEGIEMSYSVMK